MPVVTLNDGHPIPQLGFGVFQIPPSDTEEATARALAIGYRHIDTAEMYRNEQEVGRAVARSGLDRAEVFVTSKLNNGFHRSRRRPPRLRQDLAPSWGSTTSTSSSSTGRCPTL